MKDILELLYSKKISIEEAEKRLKEHFLEVSEIAKLDMHREFKAGIPEIVLAEGKEPQDVFQIALKFLEKKGGVIVTKARKEDFELFKKSDYITEFNKRAKTIILRKTNKKKEKKGKVGILAAGTSDVPVAEEARVICEEFGCEVIKDYDVGVAGIHRLFPSIKKLVEADVDVVIVAAGMEGTLPSVVKSLIDVPVIGVPTSVGYGYGEKGVSALMAMLQSCSPGIGVVNIDNGFGAASLAYLICKRVAKKKEKT